MRKAIFLIPENAMLEFAGVLKESGLDNEVAGRNDNDEIIINILYNPSDRAKVFELQEWLEDYSEENDDENDDDDENED